MLTPFRWCVLTIEEASQLKKYIETTTAKKGHVKNIKGIEKAGMLKIYEELDLFIKEASFYETELRYLDPYKYEVRRDDYYD